MRVLYLTAHLSDVDVVQRELDKASPGVVLEPRASASDVAAALERREAVDAVVVDAVSVPNATGVIGDLRARFDVAIVALVRPGQPEAMTEALLAGADQVLARRPGAADALRGALEAARRPPAPRPTAPGAIRIGWAGDVPSARRAFGAVPPLALEPLPWDAETGEPALPDDPATWPDAFVLDETIGAMRVLHAVETLARRGGGRPVFVVTSAGAAREAAYRRRGAAGTVAPSALSSVVPFLEDAVARERARREAEALRAREMRLRAVVETLPHGVLRVARDGSVLAVNLLGLSALGAERPQQVVGKNLVALAEADSRTALAQWLSEVCGGNATSTMASVTGVDHESRRLDLRGTPFRRDPQGLEVLAVVSVVPADEPPASTDQVSADDAAPWRERIEQLTDELHERRALAEEAADARDAAMREAARLAEELAAERMAWQDARVTFEQRLRALEEQQAQEAVDAARRALRLQQLEEAHHSELAALQEALAEAQALVSDAHTVATDEAIEARARELDEVRARAAELERALDEARAEVAAVTATLATRDAEAEARDQREQQATSRVAELEATLADERRRADQRARALREEADAAHTRFEAAAAESGARVRHLLAELERERTSLASVQQETERLRDTERTYEATIASLTSARAAAETRARDLADTHLQLEQTYQRTMADVEQLRADVAAASVRAESTARAYDVLRAQATTLEHDLTTSHQQLALVVDERDLATAARAEAAHELERLRATVEEAESRRSALEGALEQERARASALEAAADAAERARAAAAHELERLRATVEEAESQRLALEGALEQERARASALEAAADAAERARAEAAHELERLRATVEEAESRRSALEGELEQERARASALEAAADAAERARAEAAHELERLRATVEEAESRRSALEGELEQERARASALEAAADAAERARAEAAHELERLRATVEEAESRRSALEGELEQERARASALEAAADAAERARAEAAHELERLRATVGEAESRRSALEGALEQERARASALEAAADAAERARAAAAHELERLRATVEEAESRRLALEGAFEQERARASASEADLDRERARASTLTAEASAAQDARNDALEELARVRAALEQSFARRADLEQTTKADRERLASLTREVESSQQSRNAALEELGRVRLLFDTTAGRLSALEAERESDRSRAAQQTAELAAMAAARDALAADVERLRALATSLDTRRGELETELRRLTDRETGLAADHERLRESLAEALRQLDQARQRLVDAEGERETLRQTLRQAEASAALASSRQAEERLLVERALDEARARLAGLEGEHRAQQDALERRLRRTEEREALLLASAPFGLATVTPQGALISCNDLFARWCGATSAADLMARQPVRLPMSLQIHAGAETVVPKVEACVEQADGRLVWLEGVASPVTSEVADSAWRWTFADVTERQLRLRQARQTRRLEALASLASSASHDLGDLMAGAREAIDALAAGGGSEAATAAARAAVAKATALAQQLAAFAHRQARPAQLVDLARLTSDLAPTLRRLVGADVVLETTTPSPVYLSADPDELEQVVAALAMAGRDALPVGGTVSIGVAAQALRASGDQPTQRVGVLSCTAAGFGVRAATPATSAAETVAQQGGHLRVDHVAGRHVTFEAIWPLVQTVSTGANGTMA